MNSSFQTGALFSLNGFVYFLCPPTLTDTYTELLSVVEMEDIHDFEEIYTFHTIFTKGTYAQCIHDILNKPTHSHT